jgi:hypothetical protein
MKLQAIRQGGQTIRAHPRGRHKKPQEDPTHTGQSNPTSTAPGNRTSAPVPLLPFTAVRTAETRSAKSSTSSSGLNAITVCPQFGPLGLCWRIAAWCGMVAECMVRTCHMFAVGFDPT